MTDLAIHGLTNVTSLLSNDEFAVSRDPHGVGDDGRVTSEVVRQFVVANTSGIGLRRPIFLASSVKGLLCAPPGVSASSAVSSGLNDKLVMRRFVAGESITVAEIGIYLQAAGAAGTKARLGIYADRPDKSGPAALLVDSGEIATDTTGYVSAVISQLIQAGTPYWSASIFNGTPAVCGNALSASATAPLGYNVTSHSNVGFWAMWRAATYGALPADETAQSYSMSGVNGPFVFYDI